MDAGWIKLHRQIIDSRVFLNEGLFKVWMWCLLKANHKEKWVSFKTGKHESEILVKPGQFIFGRNTAAKELRMKPDTLYSRIQKLKKMENINIQPNTHYSIISIVNWDTYQNDKEVLQQVNQQPDTNQTPTKHQPPNTNKNVKKEKKEKKAMPFSPEKFREEKAKLGFNRNAIEYSIGETVKKIKNELVPYPYEYADTILLRVNGNYNEKETRVYDVTFTPEAIEKIESKTNIVKLKRFGIYSTDRPVIKNSVEELKRQAELMKGN